MVQPDYRGARGSNAGDDFHELWALRQALALLDQDAELIEVTVEGLRAEDESGTPPDAWDGVDCALYYGRDQDSPVERIAIEQFKYSAASPDDAWTVARLTYSTNKKGDNSVVGRLAKAFAELKGKRPDLVASGKVLVRLISNQPVDPGVVAASSGHGTPDEGSDERRRRQSDRTVLLSASGLKDEEFAAFVSALDLSECGHGSRFAIEERVLTEISEWTDDDARTTLSDLLRLVHRAMTPEAKGESITRQSILAWFGFSDRAALFPCRSAINRADRLIPRTESESVVQQMKSGAQRICLHGEAGCGKTTALQEVEALLPHGSLVVVFDCYGGGRYLDSDAYRHRPRDAFLQLSNELALRLRLPLLVSRSADLDYPRVFKKRLEKAASSVASRAQDALLVIVVDAADNSITAATTRSPQDPSFVQDFVTLGDLPTNVRFVVTARTGRLPTLRLPAAFVPLPVKGFTRDETAAHVRGIWNDAADTWIDDFHHLSGGNPRVQQYALKYAESQPGQALEYLRPNGKALDQIFRERLEEALRKVGRPLDIKTFCAGVAALPRPIPQTDLSAVTGLDVAHLRDLCADLAPGVRLTNEAIGLADEDFEHFLRAEAEAQLSEVRARIADYFLSRHKSDAYAAAHVASALFAAGRGREIIDLISAEKEPTAIGDPVLRREAQLGRLRIAMRVCREAGNTVEAMLTLLIGAEALKTDAAIRRMLVENPDLAANFARDESSRIVLRDPNEIENHGRLLFHLMAADAQRGDAISVREESRQVHAWMHRRAAYFEEQKKTHPNFQLQGWSIKDHDIAAETEAVLRIEGPRPAVAHLVRWRPRALALRVASVLSRKLITAGEAFLVERCITEAEIRTPWDLFLLTPLAFAGRAVDLSRLQASLSKLLRRKLIHLEKLRDAWTDDNASVEYFDTILTACELVVARGGDPSAVIPVLEAFAKPEQRRRDRVFTSQAFLIDFTLRAHSLLEGQAGREMSLETYLIDPPAPPDSIPSKEAKRQERIEREKKEELQNFIGPLIELYNLRARALLGSIPLAEVDVKLREAIGRYQSHEYRYSRNPSGWAMQTRLALSIARLMTVPGLDRALLLERATSVLNSRSPLNLAEISILESFALDGALHQQILTAASARAAAVRNLRASAEDKLSALVSLARLLVPFSHADANGIFNTAIEVAGEIDAEAVHEIALFAPLANRAVESLDTQRRRSVASDIAIVVGDAGVRLAGQEHFPWRRASRALATLDVCLALAATGRWEDSNIVDRATCLPPILETALSRRDLSPTQVCALSSLLDQLSKELIIRIARAAREQRESLDPKALCEELAREELLRFGRGTRPKVSGELSLLLAAGDGPGFWLDQLVRATTFLTRHPARGPSGSTDDEKQWRRSMTDAERLHQMSAVNWATARFVSAASIDNAVWRIFEASRASDSPIFASEILDRMRSAVAPGDRALHLKALSECESPRLPDYELAQAIATGVGEWHDLPSVRGWCRERLGQVLVKRLPAFSRWLPMDQSALPGLLEKSGMADHEVCGVLLEGMEHHVNGLDAPSVYALVGLIGRYCEPSEAAQLVERYAARLVQRIPTEERDRWDLADIPTEAAEAVARLLYAFVGDLDVRVRWQAAHALRRLARLGDIGTLDKVVALYGRTSERSYRAPNAPFYWLAARLWLVMALDRIADETPLEARRHGLRLLEIASDDSFPHVLLRSFAKSAVRKLVECGALALGATERGALKRANTSPMRRKNGRRSYDVGLDHYPYQKLESRRFHFDTMDTLPRWYSRALRTFADLDGERFLESAERWIVDRWGVQNNPWRWDDEPRQNRFSDSSPMERFHAYLEWHAMWCATGELMQTHALARSGDNDYHTFEDWLTREGLSAPPLWLADLRSPKPLEDRLWFPPPGDVDDWVENVGDDDFLGELGFVGNAGSVVVGGHCDTRSRTFRSSTRVETALVSPDAAASLARALQSLDDSWSYRIPPAGDELEIDAPPYKLVGWLVRTRGDLGIDGRDPFRYEVDRIECGPSDKTMARLDLGFRRQDRPTWVKKRSRERIFIYEAWGDNRGDERERALRYDEAVRSSGWRLRIGKEDLRRFLNEMNLDLIVEVEVTRGNSAHDHWRDDEEKAKEARFDRVVVLRKDGAIEAAEGRIGTWTAPGT
jgi:hypothetical protein